MDADFGYTGMYQEKAANLDLTWFRAYDANKGRWLSRDPMGLKAGINLYAMVNNNPLKWVDSFGLCGDPTVTPSSSLSPTTGNPSTGSGGGGNGQTGGSENPYGYPPATNTPTPSNTPTITPTPSNTPSPTPWPLQNESNDWQTEGPWFAITLAIGQFISEFLGVLLKVLTIPGDSPHHPWVPTPTPTSSPTNTPSPTDTPTSTPTDTPTVSPSPTCPFNGSG